MITAIEYFETKKLSSLQENDGTVFNGGYYDENHVPLIEHFISNFVTYMTILAEELKNSENSNNSLLPGDLLSKSKCMLKMYKPIWEIIDHSQTEPLS